MNDICVQKHFRQSGRHGPARVAYSLERTVASFPLLAKILKGVVSNNQMSHVLIGLCTFFVECLIPWEVLNKLALRIEAQVWELRQVRLELGGLTSCESIDNRCIGSNPQTSIKSINA